MPYTDILRSVHSQLDSEVLWQLMAREQTGTYFRASMLCCVKENFVIIGKQSTIVRHGKSASGESLNTSR